LVHFPYLKLGFFLIFRGAYPHWAEAFVPTRHINV